jgi:Holliday junction resolvase
MTTPSKRKGNAAERAVANHFRDHGYPYAERTRAGWSNDRGDIDGVPGVCVEVKAEKQIALARYMEELETEIRNARAETGVVIIKRRGVSAVSDWYACAPVHIWLELLKESGR